MACYKAAVIFGLLLCVSVCAGELVFSGHETPVYVGLSRIILCKWTGLENITKLDWYLFGLEGLGLGMELGHPYTTALNPGRVTSISWNGKIFVCKANTTSGRIVRKKLTLWVKELLNEITITPPCESTCEEAPTAGDSHTLTCTVKSEQPTNLNWVRIISEKEKVVVEYTTNITISKQTQSGLIPLSTSKSITFDPLLTSHAEKYACVSILNNMGPKVVGTRQLECVVKVKIPPPCVELKSDSEANTCKDFTLTPLIEVHTDIPTDIDSSWYGHLSLKDTPRVTISNRSVQFTPLKSSDEGTYSFSVRVEPLDSKYLCPSSFVNDSIDISPRIGIHILHSKYISGQFLRNNSIIIPKSTACSGCTVNFFCLSEAPTGIAYVTFPDGSSRNTSDNYLNMIVEMQPGTTDFQVYNYKTYKPLLYGVYTCEVFDIFGPMLHYSVVIHSILPGPPRVYSVRYTDLVEVSNRDALMEVTFSTSDSPPTEVQCSCDGELIDFCSKDFDLVQVVTNRRNVYYDNIIVVKNATKVAGKHTYQCNISNSQGRDTSEIETNIPVYNSIVITKTGSNKKGEKATLLCSVQLRGELKYFLPYIKLEWSGPSGAPTSKDSGIKSGVQQFSSRTSSLALVLGPLETHHKGLYRCNASISIPSLIPFFWRTTYYEMIVQCQDIFQLKFGPVIHCSKWHLDWNYMYYLEHNIKTALVTAINSRCNCGFSTSAIDLGEFTCRQTGEDAIYRARITGTVYTSSELLDMIYDWIETEGNFLSTYNGRVRLWIDPNVPLRIPSFFEPEPAVNSKDGE